MPSKSDVARTEASPKPRRRKDPRGSVTRAALIEAAEELFAERGIDSVSLRQIGEAIGSDNNAVVTYYFGSKAGLIKAIYEYRIPQLEARRSELLSKLDENGLGSDPYALFFAQWSPIFEQRNKKGKASYAGLLANIGKYTEVSIKELSQFYPKTREIMERLFSAVALDETTFYSRMHLISILLSEAISKAVELEESGQSPAKVQAAFSDALELAAAAAVAPRQSVAKELFP